MNSDSFESISRSMHLEDDRHFNELTKEEQSWIIKEIATADRMVEFYDRRTDNRTAYIILLAMLGHIVLAIYFHVTLHNIPVVLVTLATSFLSLRMLRWSMWRSDR